MNVFQNSSTELYTSTQHPYTPRGVLPMFCGQVALLFGPFLNHFHMLRVNPSTVHRCVERCIIGDKTPGTDYCCSSVVNWSGGESESKSERKSQALASPETKISLPITCLV